MSNIYVQGDNNKVRGDSNKKIITISIGLVAIVIVAFIFISSSNSMEKKIIGTWKLGNSMYEFTDDGQLLYLSGSNDGMTITYTLNNDKIKLNINILWGNATVIADVDISDNTLTLSNFIDPDDIFGVDGDDTWVFTKVN